MTSRLVRSALALAALSLAAGCSHAVPRPEVPDEPIPAGQPTTLQLRSAAPEGAEVRWDPGDGSPPVTGPSLAHTWHRPGRYTVRVFSGDAVSEQTIEVRPREPLELVPADVEQALFVPRFFGQLSRGWKILRRVGPDGQADALRSVLQRRLGVDPDDEAALVAAGFDPAEGVAVLELPQDPGATWVLIGVLDPRNAMELGARYANLLEPREQLVEGMPLVIAGEGTRWGSAYGLVDGYLAIRSGGSDRVDLAKVFAHLVRRPTGRLSDVEAWRRGRAEAPGDDAVAYARLTRFAEGKEPQVVVAGLSLSDDETTTTLSVQLPPSDRESLRNLLGDGDGVPELVRRLPAGELGFLSLSVRPQALYEFLIQDSARRLQLDGVSEEMIGLSASRLLSVFTGNLVAALYVDDEQAPHSLVELDVDAKDAPPTLLVLELAEDRAAREALLQLLRSTKKLTPIPGRRDVWDFRGGRIALEKGRLVVALGSPALLDQPAGGKASLESLDEALLARGGQIVLHAALGRIYDRMLASPGPKDDPAAAARRTQRLASRLQWIRGFDDLLAQVRMSETGFAGSLRIRLRRDLPPLPQAAPPSIREVPPGRESGPSPSGSEEQEYEEETGTDPAP